MNEITYRQEGDYLIPNIGLPETTDHTPLGMYGRMRREYLKEHRPILWDRMILQGTLFPHLREIQQTATLRMEQLMAQLLQKNPAPDKKTDQMGWVQHMNSLRAQAEEIVTSELITS